MSRQPTVEDRAEAVLREAAAFGFSSKDLLQRAASGVVRAAAAPDAIEADREALAAAAHLLAFVRHEDRQ